MSQVDRGRIGRNAPCPCGSGRKYKRCCLAADEAAARVPAADPDDEALAAEVAEAGAEAVSRGLAWVEAPDRPLLLTTDQALVAIACMGQVGAPAGQGGDLWERLVDALTAMGLVDDLRARVGAGLAAARGPEGDPLQAARWADLARAADADPATVLLRTVRNPDLRVILRHTDEDAFLAELLADGAPVAGAYQRYADWLRAFGDLRAAERVEAVAGTLEAAAVPWEEAPA